MQQFRAVRAIIYGTVKVETVMVQLDLIPDDPTPNCHITCKSHIFSLSDEELKAVSAFFGIKFKTADHMFEQ